MPYLCVQQGPAELSVEVEALHSSMLI